MVASESTNIDMEDDVSRVQLALNVSDLEGSVDFYSAMFGVTPHKRRPGYANFAIENPPLKLVLIEVPEGARGTGAAGALNHLGVEVFSSDEVHEAAERFTSAGLATFDETDTTCCYALQDKVWVHDPAGAPWEVYVVKVVDLHRIEGACCAPTSSVCCADS